MNILNWQHWHILNVVESSYDYQIIAEPLTHPLRCLHCESSLLYRHEKKQQLFLDIPLHGKRTGIQVVRCRYVCRSCHRKFWEPLPEMAPSHMMTQRLVDYIEQAAQWRTFASIAQETGLDEKTIRLVFRETSNAAIPLLTPASLTWLGIDEMHLPKPYGVFSDIKNKCVVDLLPNRSKKTIIRALYQLPQREKIELVTIDMWRPYADATRLILPQATIIVDRFHVVRMANDALETVRKSVRTQLSDAQRKGLMHDRYILLRRKANLNESKLLILEAWTQNIPALGIAYELKESFFDLWNAESRDQALTLYQDWQKRIPPDLQSAFQPLLTAMTNWQTEIFNYVDHKITNSYTEALNGQLRLM